MLLSFGRQPNLSRFITQTNTLQTLVVAPCAAIHYSIYNSFYIFSICIHTKSLYFHSIICWLANLPLFGIENKSLPFSHGIESSFVLPLRHACYDPQISLAVFLPHFATCSVIQFLDLSSLLFPDRGIVSHPVIFF